MSFRTSAPLFSLLLVSLCGTAGEDDDESGNEGIGLRAFASLVKGKFSALPMVMLSTYPYTNIGVSVIGDRAGRNAGYQIHSSGTVGYGIGAELSAVDVFLGVRLNIRLDILCRCHQTDRPEMVR